MLFIWLSEFVHLKLKVKEENTDCCTKTTTAVLVEFLLSICAQRLRITAAQPQLTVTAWPFPPTAGELSGGCEAGVVCVLWVGVLIIKGRVQSHQQAVAPRCLWPGTSLHHVHQRNGTEIFTAVRGQSGLNELTVQKMS